MNSARLTNICKASSKTIEIDSFLNKDQFGAGIIESLMISNLYL